MKNSTAFLSIILLLVGLTFSTEASFAQGAQQLSEENARKLAIAKVREFGNLAKIYDDSLIDRSGEFLQLFNLNASLPLDFIAGKSEQLESPSKYLAEFYSGALEKPIPYSFEILERRTRVSSRGGNDGYKVIVPIRKKFSHLVKNKQLIFQTTPFVVIQDVELVVNANGATKINRVLPAAMSIPNRWSLDIALMNNLAAPTINDGAGIGLQQVAIDEIDLTNFSVGLNYHFYPFANGKKFKKNISFILGIGAEHWRYSLAPRQVADREDNYRSSNLWANEISNGVENSILNAGGENFVRVGEAEFGEEKLRFTALSLRAAVQIPLIIKENSQTSLEIGLGYTAGSTTDVSYNRAYNDSLAFAEGPFSDNPVVITNEGVSYNGATENLESPLPSYGLEDGTGEQNYTVQLSSTLNADFKLIQMFKLGAYDLGGYVTVRQQFSSPLSSGPDSNQSLFGIVDGGVPRIVAFTDQLLPMYLGLGIRVRKSK